MNGYLVDTNILSELTKPTPAAWVEAFVRQSKDRVFVNVFSIGEIRKGIASLPGEQPARRSCDWNHLCWRQFANDRKLLAQICAILRS